MAFAFDAGIGVDHIDIPLRDGINRALRQTNPASNAVFGNLKRQFLSPPFPDFFGLKEADRTPFLCIQYTNPQKNEIQDFFERAY